MNSDIVHKKTGDWLMEQSTICIREFELSRTQEERTAARNKLLELKGRIRSEVRALDKIIYGD